MTKVHPKQSDMYNRKTYIRQMREPLRQELKVAKQIYIQMYGSTQKFEHRKLLEIRLNMRKKNASLASNHTL